MKVEFTNLKQQYLEIKSEVDAGLKKLFSKSNFILGKEVKDFEKAFSHYCGSKFGVGLNSGTDALFLGCLSLGIGQGDEVIVPAFTFIATAFAVTYTGAKVVFVDIDEKTKTIDVKKIEKAVTKKTKAIIPVHLYGQSADMDEIIAIAKRHKLKIIEDAAQAHGAQYKGRSCGSMSDVGCFSFYPTKNLGAFGDGGMVVTDNKKIYEKLTMLRDCGRLGRYKHTIKGYNSRLDTMQAVMLTAKLKHLDKWNKMRQENASLYNSLLKDEEKIITPFQAENRNHIFHIYAVRVKKRDFIIESMLKKGINALIHYPFPLHLQEAYQELGYKKGDFPIAEKVASEIISLPMSPHLSKEKIKFVAKILKDLIDGR
ncbi:MAG: DegT/DnrJ/EryC1/StrS family aminotransferase [Candidatus Omnitrophota bacterium]|nr:DegT/DnrJ/EryC1/StrS family aminotransferase [Candidatus Omnitrophota bacterium]